MKIKHAFITSIILIFPPFYSFGQEINQSNRVSGDYSLDNIVRIDEPGMKNQYYLSKNKTTDLRFTIKGGNYSKVRIEGMNKWKSLSSGVKYIRKYINKVATEMKQEDKRARLRKLASMNLSFVGRNQNVTVSLRAFI